MFAFLQGHDLAPIVDASHIENNLVMWHTRILDVVVEEVGIDVWNRAELAGRDKHDLRDGVRQKNPLVITATIETLWKDGIRSALLEELSERVLKYAKQAAH